MNTIQGFQIFSPIGFMMYPCKYAHFCKECETCDVSQGSGYFDKTNFDVVSFYSRDYVQGMLLNLLYATLFYLIFYFFFSYSTQDN